MENTSTSEKLVKREDLVPGMKVARDVENRFGGVLIPAGSILTASRIEKLEELNYYHIYVAPADKEKISENAKKLSSQEKAYRQDMEKAAALYRRIKYEEGIDYKEFKDLTENALDLSTGLEVDDLLNMVRDVDEYIYAHLLNVGILSSMMGRWLNLSDDRVEKLTQAGLLHDVGKTMVPDEILYKPGPLTEEEFEEVKQHTRDGYRIVQKSDFISREVAQGVLTHHEEFGGSGYPLGLIGREIPLFGRILAIVDAFDAITAERVHRRKRSPFQAMKIFKSENFTHYDVVLREVFMEKVPNYFLHEKVRLSSGEEGKVAFIDPRQPEYPLVKTGDEYIDLSENPDIKIKEIIKA